MKGFFITVQLMLLALIFLLPKTHAVLHEINLEEQSILILKSRESSYYNKTIHSLSGYFQSGTSFLVHNVKEKPKLGAAKTIIALGLKASLYSRDNFPNTPKVFAFLTEDQSQKISIKSNETHLLIEQSPKRYFSFAKALFPNKTIGVLTKKNQESLNNENTKIRLVHINDQNDILSATRSLIKLNDVFLALPDKEIFNRKSLKGILLTTYQSETPLISYSPAHVKAGAIAAIYSSTSNLGKHIAEVTKNVISKQDIDNSRQFSKYYSIQINRKVAQSLRINILESDEIIKTMDGAL